MEGNGLSPSILQSKFLLLLTNNHIHCCKWFKAQRGLEAYKAALSFWISFPIILKFAFDKPFMYFNLIRWLGKNNYRLSMIFLPTICTSVRDFFVYLAWDCCFHGASVLQDIENEFDSQIGEGPRVLIHVWEGNLRDALSCQILVMVLTRRRDITFLMVSRSLLCTIPATWIFWWCITGDCRLSAPLFWPVGFTSCLMVIEPWDSRDIWFIIFL